MISLGLQRIRALLAALGRPERRFGAIHVAGTNGKGSVCAYISSVLSASHISHGMFTSPHLVHQRDSIRINGRVVDEVTFRKQEATVNQCNLSNNINATPFELLTATAFQILANCKIGIAIIEVGMGGLEDATNVFEKPLVTIITNVSKDHQAFLGNTLREIARQKAGIMKKGVVSVVDHSNAPEVLDEVEMISNTIGAKTVQSSRFTFNGDKLNLTDLSAELWDLTVPLKGSYQPFNISCAVSALVQLQAQVQFSNLSAESIHRGIANTSWPGRLSQFEATRIVSRITDGAGPARARTFVIDGAHNEQAALFLARHVDEFRERQYSIAWILGFSRGKDYQGILSTLVQARDAVAGVEFGEVQGMPWVKPVASSDIVKPCPHSLSCGTDLQRAVAWAACQADIVVVAGSLYLVGEMYKLFKLNE